MIRTPIRRRLVGMTDISWVLFILLAATLSTALLLGYLRDGFQLFQMGHELAQATVETRRLEDERRSLSLEIQHRSDSFDPWEAAGELGLQPPRDEQVIEVTR
jgi:hypothetical protein